jgi:hypothetical protein
MLAGSANQRDTTAGRVHRSAFLISRLEIPGWYPIDGGIGRTLCIAALTKPLAKPSTKTIFTDEINTKR